MEKYIYVANKIKRLSTISRDRVLEGLVFYLSFLPWFWLLGVMGLVTRARIYLGYWPKSSHPDPQFLPAALDSYQAILWSGFNVLKWSPLAFPLCYCVSKALGAPSRRLLIATFLGGWLAILLMIFVAEIDFVSWFLD